MNVNKIHQELRSSQLLLLDVANNSKTFLAQSEPSLVCYWNTLAKGHHSLLFVAYLFLLSVLDTLRPILTRVGVGVVIGLHLVGRWGDTEGVHVL